LLLVLDLIIEKLPFVIVVFHSDNGSKYINHNVTKMLEKFRIEQTKSRSRQSNANALAESKNASVVRKHMGYEHLPKKYVKRIYEFYQKYFNPWLNLQRPYMFSTRKIDPKEKIIKVNKHKDVKTPLDALERLNKLGLVKFKKETTMSDLKVQDMRQTDLEIA